MTFEPSQIFVDEYPPEAAEWCNQNGDCYITEIEAAADGSRRFQIVAIPESTPEELAEQERFRKQAEAEAARVPDLEAAVAELGATTSSDKEESDAAALDLAAYAAELEARIAKLEEKNNG